MALKASFLATGLTTRIHGNTRRLLKHALKLHEVKNLVTFLNFAEKNAILLPGQISGYKRDDLQLLPSNTTKKVSHLSEREMYKNLMTVCTLTKQMYKATYLYIIGCIGGVQTLCRQGRCQSRCLQYLLYTLASVSPANYNETHV